MTFTVMKRVWKVTPHRCKAGGKIRSGPQVGKVATSPLPYRGSPPLQSGGKIRSGPQVGKLATSSLPYREYPPLQSGGQNQKWPTSGQSGYLTPAVSGIPTAAERGAKSQVAHKWAKWLPHPCRIGDPHRFRAGGKIRSGPQVGKVATSALPYQGSPPLQSGGQNQKWPTRGQIGYLTPAVSGIPAAAERGAKSEVAHKWAKLLPHPCRIGDPHRFRAGGKIRSGPQVGKVATSPLPYRGSPTLQSGGQNRKWPTSGQSGYLTPAVSGIPTAAERGAKSEVAHKRAKWLPQPCRIGDPHRFRAGAKSKVAHKWANWLPHPCRIGDPLRFKAGGKIRNVQKKGGNATSPLHCGGSIAKGTKSKVAELGARTKLCMCSPKEQHQKKIAQVMCVRRKTPLKPPLGPFLKKEGGGFQNPPRYRISRKPPPGRRPAATAAAAAGGGHAPLRPARKKPASRIARKTPPPQAQQSKPKVEAKTQDKGKGTTTPSQTPSPPLVR